MWIAYTFIFIAVIIAGEMFLRSQLEVGVYHYGGVTHRQLAVSNFLFSSLLFYGGKGASNIFSHVESCQNRLQIKLNHW